MIRFIFASLLFLTTTSQVQLHGQGAVPATGDAAAQEPAVISTIQFKEQLPERQQHILAHPEQFRVLENGTVEILALPKMDLNPKATAPNDAKTAPAQAENPPAPQRPDTPKKLNAIDLLSMPPAVQWTILQHQEDHEITKSTLKRAEFDRLRPDQKATIEANPSLFTIQQ